MSRGYKFNLKGTRVGIDTAALYGYWEWLDGSEGGGLWFESLPEGPLDLVDYDGYASLPAAIIRELRELGVTVDADFE